MTGSQVLSNVTASSDRISVTVRVQLDLGEYRKLPPKLRRAVIVGCNRAAKPVRAAVVGHAEKIKRFGFLAKSIGTKTKFNAKTGTVVTVIGPKMSFARVKGKYTRGPRKGQKRWNEPWLYARFLEGGTVHAKPKQFLQPAFDAQGQRFIETARAEVAAEMAKVLGGG